jgi:hypothetical protein
VPAAVGSSASAVEDRAPAASAVEEPPEAPLEPSTGPRSGHPVIAYLVAGASYLALGVGLWWGVWATHPTATASCGCGDPALFTWFLDWPAHALAHGANPFYSTAMFHPGGINLLSNTSVLAVGIPLAPVTWLFGPVATLNVASTLAPALSALAAFWLARRYVRWTPAAWLAGLLYGFSPFMLGSLVFAHLMTSVLIVPPLVVGLLDELCLRQRRRPVLVGVGLGLLVALEFFLSTELLVIMGVATVVGLGLLVVAGLAGHRDELARRLPHALVGLGTGIGVSVVLLAWPAWYALAGPAHLSGAIWPHLPLGGYFLGSFTDGRAVTAPLFQISGYSGPVLSSAYLGWGLLAVLVAGTVAFRRDRRPWFFGALGLVTAAISLSVGESFWVPWKALQHLPQFENVIEERFALVFYLAAAVMLAVIIDRVHGALAGAGQPADPVTDQATGDAGAAAAHSADESAGLDGVAGADGAAGGAGGPGAGDGLAPAGRPRRGGVHRSKRGTRRWVRPVLAGAGALAVAAVALGPVAAAVAPTVPFRTEPVVVPRWFTRVAPHLPGRPVLLVLPAPFSGIQSSLAWQALGSMQWSQVGGGGPQGVARRAGAERPGFEVIADLNFGFHPPSATPAQLTAVRRALAGWGVTEVVVPWLPLSDSYFERGNDARLSVALMTAALGTPPVWQAGAWVWPRVDLRTPALPVAPGTVARCSALPVGGAGGGHLAVARCVEAAGKSLAAIEEDG